MSIAEAGEFGLIARIVARLDISPATLLGPGDDGAVVVDRGDPEVVYAVAGGRLWASTEGVRRWRPCPSASASGPIEAKRLALVPSTEGFCRMRTSGRSR